MTTQPTWWLATMICLGTLWGASGCLPDHSALYNRACSGNFDCEVGDRCLDGFCQRLELDDDGNNDPQCPDPNNPQCGDDGNNDVEDLCPDDPDKLAPGVCGCGTPDEGDSDADGALDCVDGCPEDNSKQAPGFCGCGEVETDSDNDGTPDCDDECPGDLAKTTPGVCGCGQPEGDGDGDGTPDCDDLCPRDPEKLEPGDCGCNVLDVEGCSTDIIVNSTEDNLIAGDGQCTLREAIRNANSDRDETRGDCLRGSDADVIILPAGTITLDLVGPNENLALTGDLDIRSSTTIRGAGTDQTIIDGNGTDRIIHVTARRIDILLEDLTLTGGRTPRQTVCADNWFNGNGFDFENELGVDGGAYWQREGSLTMNRVRVTRNEAYCSGGGIMIVGVAPAGYGNTIDNNVAGHEAGGISFMRSTTHENGFRFVTNWTISNNHAGVRAGGLFFTSNCCGLQLEGFTVVGNSAGVEGGGIHEAGFGLNMFGAIITGNTLTNEENNGTFDCSGDFGGQDSVVGSFGSPNGCVGMRCASNNAVNPGSPESLIDMELKDNGGPVPTHAPNAGGIAIDFVRPNTVGVNQNGIGHCGTERHTVDARGVPRTRRCDAGAHEVGSAQTQVCSCRGTTFECVPDRDADGTFNNDDNCPSTYNPDQANNDQDTQGDECDTDDDNDTVVDEEDNCPFDANTDQRNTDGDSQGDLCDDDDDNDTILDAQDQDPLDALVCLDTDNDQCDDCASGTFAPLSDGDDIDLDGLCDVGDPCQDIGISTTPSDIDTGQFTVNALAVGDLNNDGHLDLAITSTSDPEVFLLGDGAGNFTNVPNALNTGNNTQDVVLLHANDDPFLDAIIATDGSAIEVWQNNGSAAFERISNFSWGEHRALATADLDQDGDLDVVAAMVNGVSTFLNNGDGTFTAAFTQEATQIIDVTTGDLNGDTHPDILFISADDVDGVLINDTEGGFELLEAGFEATGNVGVSLGHFNGDGQLDAMTVGAEGTPAQLWLGVGDGNFVGTGQSFAQGVSTIDAPLLEDFDRDGHLDVLLLHRNASSIILLGDGDGNLTPAPVSLSTPSTASAATGLFNDDLRPDIAVLNANGPSNLLDNQPAESLCD